MLAAVAPSAVSPDIIWWHHVFVLSLCFIQMNILSYLNISLSCISSCKICSAIYRMANNLTRERINGFDDFTTLQVLLFRFAIRLLGKAPYFFCCWECSLRASNENESLWNKIIIVIIKHWIHIVPIYSYIFVSTFHMFAVTYTTHIYYTSTKSHYYYYFVQTILHYKLYWYFSAPWKLGTCLIICLHLSPRRCLQAPHTFIKITHCVFWQLGIFFIFLPKKCFLYIMETRHSFKLHRK